VNPLTSPQQSLLLTLEEISRLVSHSGNASETLSNIVQLLQQRFETDVCSVYLLEPDRSTLVLAATDPARRLRGSAAEAAWLLRAAASYLRVRGQERTAEVLIHDADDLEPPRGPAAPGTRAAPPEPELCRTGRG